MSNFTQPKDAARNLRATIGTGTLARDTDQVDIATLARGLIDPRTGVPGLYVNESGAIVGSTGASIFPQSAGIAYLTASGNDETGVVGDSKFPYETIQGAYDDGARYFIMGIGDFGDLTISGDNVLWLVGYGTWNDYESDGATPASQIGTINCGTHGLILQDVHGFSVWIEAISAIGANGATGGTDLPGAAGSSLEQTLAFRMCELGSITVRGGDGGDGGALDVEAATNGGAGGSADVYLALDNTRVFGAIIVEGGTGGDCQGTGVSGAGGASGGGEIIHDSEVGAVNFNGGDAGSAGSGTQGDGGSVGALTMSKSSAAVIDMDGGSGTTPGTDGTLSTSNSSYSVPTNVAAHTSISDNKGSVASSNGQDVVPLFSRVTGSNATTTGQALTNITGLSVALLANAVYEFEANLTVSTSAVTTGTRYGIQFSTAGAAVEATAEGSLTTASHQSERVSALNTGGLTYLTTSGQSGAIKIRGIVTTGANAGNLTAQHLKVTSGTSTVFVNSFLQARRIG